MYTFDYALNYWNNWAVNCRARNVPEKTISKAQKLMDKLQELFLKENGYDSAEEADGKISKNIKLGEKSEAVFLKLLSFLASGNEGLNN